MPGPTGNYTPTTIREIAAALQTQFVENSPCTSAEQFIITALEPDEVPHLTGDFDYVFSIGSERDDTRMIDGSGRTVNCRIRSCTLSVRSRLLLDPVGSDALHLLDAGAGHTVFEDAAFNALESFDPVDSSGNPLVTTVCRLGRLGKARRQKGNEEWLLSTVDVEVPYIRRLSLKQIQ